MVRCSFKSHNSSKVREKSMHWYATFRVSVANHLGLMLKGLALSKNNLICAQLANMYILDQSSSDKKFF